MPLPKTECILIGLYLLVGCSSSPPIHYYTLSANTGTESVGSEPLRLNVIVGPVSVPEAVDRSQLVLRVAANQVTIVDHERWAAPLRSEISRVIADNLAHSVDGARVSTFQQNATKDANFRVIIDVQNLDSVLGDAINMNALWAIQANNGMVLKTGQTRVHEPTQGGGYDALVGAHSRAFQTLSSDIAGALRTLANSSANQ